MSSNQLLIGKSRPHPISSPSSLHSIPPTQPFKTNPKKPTELLALSSSISSLQNLQLINFQQPNSLINFSPDLINFVQGCSNSFNQLAQFTSSPVNSLLINLNSNSNACLEELLQLEQLFLSGNSNVDLNNNGQNSNLNNGQDLSNSTASVDSSNSTASVDVSNSTAAVNSSANAAPVAVAQQGNAKGGKADAKGKKGEKRGIEEVVKRSGASKKQVLTGMGLGVMMVAGVFAL